MTVSINQPAYLPWLGYFERIVNSDLHIVLDHVQFEKNSFVNRNKIRMKEGWCWLTVPVHTKGMFGALPIHDLQIDNVTKWPKKHIESIRQNYRKGKYFDEYFPEIEKILTKENIQFAPMVDEINHFMLKSLDIKTQLLYSSRMDISGSKSDLVLNLCKAVNATTYISGNLGKGYIEEHKFNKEGIKVIYQEYKHPEYVQAYSGFEPYMAAIDLLFNHGPNSLKILKNLNND